MNYIYLWRKTKGRDTSLYFVSHNDLDGCKAWVFKQYNKLLKQNFTNVSVYDFETHKEKLAIRIIKQPPQPRTHA